jgi:hypothetical protein
MLGGGPKYIARNRFNLYRFAIEKHVAQKPPVHLSLVLSKEHDQVSCEARIEHGDGASASDSGQLHIALVERSVDYTGGNGISRQSFVVRKLAGGSEGTSVAFKGSRQKFTQKIDLREVETEIQKLLDDPRGQNSWPKRLKNFNGWRARPEKIDRANLAVIAWVQDTKTHEVLQAAYQNVPLAMSTN